MAVTRTQTPLYQAPHAPRWHQGGSWGPRPRCGLGAVRALKNEKPPRADGADGADGVDGCNGADNGDGTGGDRAEDEPEKKHK